MPGVPINEPRRYRSIASRDCRRDRSRIPRGAARPDIWVGLGQERNLPHPAGCAVLQKTQLAPILELQARPILRRSDVHSPTSPIRMRLSLGTRHDQNQALGTLVANQEFGQPRGGRFRRFRAPLDKNFVDDQAARPSSWKTPRMARRMAENCPEGATFSQRGLRKSVGAYARKPAGFITAASGLRLSALTGARRAVSVKPRGVRFPARCDAARCGRLRPDRSASED